MLSVRQEVLVFFFEECFAGEVELRVVVSVSGTPSHIVLHQRLDDNIQIFGGVREERVLAGDEIPICLSQPRAA
jgi:hypothetical protein